MATATSWAGSTEPNCHMALRRLRIPEVGEFDAFARDLTGCVGEEIGGSHRLAGQAQREVSALPHAEQTAADFNDKVLHLTSGKKAACRQGLHAAGCVSSVAGNAHTAGAYKFRNFEHRTSIARGHHTGDARWIDDSC